MELTPQKKVCDLCSSDHLEILCWTRDRKLETTKDRFAIIQCKSCGIAQTCPRLTPDQLTRSYPDVYYPAKEPPKRYYKRYIERFQKDKVKKLKRVVPSGKVLDVGCGVGYFLKVANDAGYRATGIEFSEVAVDVGKKRLNLNIHLGDFLTYPFDENGFDVVTLWHSFEHLHQPRLVLQKIHTILGPCGFLVIAAPNLSSLQARIFRGRWYHLDAPRHFFHYSPLSLARLVQEHGFSVHRIDHFSREHNGSGILGSLIRLSPPNEAFIHKLLRKTLGITLANALAWFESAVYQGGTFTLFAVKQ